MAAFWKPRRQAEGGQPHPDQGDEDVNLAPPGAELLGDPELDEQLAHLEAIERRYAEAGGAAPSGEGDGPSVTVPETAWPEAIPPPPEAAEGGAALRRWLDTALAVLSARASRNRDELQRLSSQWVHISRNLTRFRADEVAAVVESEARVRERIAGDETACHVIRLLLDRAASPALDQPASEPAAAATAALVPADMAMLRSLLDDAASDRVNAAQQLTTAVLEDLSRLALDIEVVQREAEHDPPAAAEAVRGLRDRVSGVVEDLRARPGTELVSLREGEPLHATLRRCLDAYQPRLAGDLAWSGGEPADPEVPAAVLWIVQEFLAGMAASGGRSLRVGLSSGEASVTLQLSAEAAEEACAGGWVLRCRTRAAVAGGSVGVAASDGVCSVEVVFPVAAAGDTPSAR